METNVGALQEREPESPALRRYDEIARILTGDDNASADDAVAWVQNLCEVLQVPPLTAYGLTREDFTDLIQKASVASSMQGNPIRLTDTELGQILDRAL
jgi:alcohol dehydrogenase class IV